MLDLDQLLKAQRGLKFGDPDDQPTAIAIAVSAKTKQMLLEHPAIVKKISGGIEELSPASIKVVVINNMKDEEMMPLFEQWQIKAILKADASYNPKFQSISFASWASIVFKEADLNVP